MLDFNLCNVVRCRIITLRLECFIFTFFSSHFYVPFLCSFSLILFLSRFIRPDSLSLLFQQDRKKKHLQFSRSIRVDCFAKRLNEEVSRKRASLKPRTRFRCRDGGRKI